MSNLIFILIALVFTTVVMLVIMPYAIILFKKLRIGKNIRSEGLIGKALQFAELHANKKGTPTMGGAIIIFVILLLVGISVIVHAFQFHFFDIFGMYAFRHSLWNRQETYIVIFTLVSVGCIGMLDDYLNIRGIGKTQGLSAKVKMLLLIFFAFLGAYWFAYKLGYSDIHIPLYGSVSLGWLYVPLFILIIISTANSVNITDGLDGLAGGLLLFQFLAYGAITYTQGLFILSGFCMIVAGALLGFLWFNIYPAQIFMGDTGSLALGATLAIIAMMTDTLLAFIVMSSIFILETLSVMIQLTSKKLFNGKKVFKIAPFHHHLEAIGWSESTIVMRFWLIGMILAVVGVIIATIDIL